MLSNDQKAMLWDEDVCAVYIFQCISKQGF